MSPTVLVIDDAPPIRRLLRTGLATQGYAILSRFRKSGRRFCDENLRPTKDLSGRRVGLPTVHDSVVLTDLARATCPLSRAGEGTRA